MKELAEHSKRTWQYITWQLFKNLYRIQKSVDISVFLHQLQKSVTCETCDTVHLQYINEDIIFGLNLLQKSDIQSLRKPVSLDQENRNCSYIFVAFD